MTGLGPWLDPGLGEVAPRSVFELAKLAVAGESNVRLASTLEAVRITASSLSVGYDASVCAISESVGKWILSMEIPS